MTMKTFVDTVKAYSAWKLQEKGNGTLTKKEVAALREEYKKAKTASTSSDTALREAVKEYRAWKKQTKGDTTLSQKEFDMLKESVQKQAAAQPKKLNENTIKLWEQYFANYKKFKEAQEPGSKVSYKEIKLLKENFKQAIKTGQRLTEADAGFDPAAGAPVPGDPNAMGAGDPNAMPGAAPATPVDPTLAAQIQDVVQSANALAASAGIQLNDLGADPAAGMPPVDGQMPGADPNAAAGGAPAPLPEAIAQYKAWKKANKGTDKLTEAEEKALTEKYGTKPKSEYEQIKERIAARQQQIASLQENAAQDYAKSQLNAMGVGQIVSNSQGGDHSVSEEQVKVPAAKSLANGYTSGKASGETKPAKTWPTKAVKDAGGALQGAGATQTKMKEEEEKPAEEPEKKLEEKTVTDVYVAKFFEKKLSFEDLKESMKKGLLG